MVISACVVLPTFAWLQAQTPSPAISVRQGADGRLAYTADAEGNRVIDFSHAGYSGGGVPIPDIPARTVLGPGGEHDRLRIQAALDLVAASPPDASGFRGAVLLERGTYRIDGSLLVAASGVVLRGAGAGPDGTVLVATGTSRRSLVMVEGTGERTEIAGSRTSVAAAYVPVGARTIPVQSIAGLSVGSRVVITRPSTKEWVARLGMNTFPGWRPENRLHWQPGSRDVVWDRVVTAVADNNVTIDAPLTTALDERDGGGSLARYAFPGRIDHIGVESLRLVSEYDTTRPMDEDHAWFAVTLDKVEHAWVRDVVAQHFAGSVINVRADARAVTIEDVEALAPVSEVGGYRRHVFHTAGQQTLFRRCRSEFGRHDFVVGFTAAGPNVFLECTARHALDDSGPIESWASGVLYDNVIIRGHALRLTNRGTAGQGQGWAAANSVLWNSEATDVEVQSPSGAVNQAYGCKGVMTGDGIVWDPRTDDLEAVAAGMPPRAAFYQHYGLWYDRRRVDHNYYGSPEQRTGDVWPPFMESPWARSGQGKAWDGLSRYDLTRFNPWYFERMKAFADLADRKALILYHNFYFQHWLLESRSHYVDFPWRPTNTIQVTGLPDEVPAAHVFYDVSDPLRHDLHRRYIRHALDLLGNNTNVVHGIDREYTGPIEFVRFWLDTIAEWEKERGKRVFIALEIPKGQMDAILDDPVRGPQISAIDVLGWTYRADGALFAARGGINRAPREQRPDIATPAELDALKRKLGISALDQKDFLNGPEFQRLFDTLWASSPPMRYRAWREYRDRYPRTVPLWNGDEYPALTRAVEQAIPVSARAGSQPTELVLAPRETSWAVAKSGEMLLVYSTAGLPVELDLSQDVATYSVRWIGSGANRAPSPSAQVRGRRVVRLTPPVAGSPSVAWLSRVR